MFVEIQGLRTYVERAGAGEPVLLLHGWGASSRAFAPTMETLARSYTVWALDFPGFGLSLHPGDAWGVHDYAAFTLDAMTRLGLERTHLIGHSFGGRVSIVIAAGHADRVDRLVLVNSAGIRPPRTLGLRARGFVARNGRRLLSQPIAGRAGRRALEALYGRLGMSDYRDAGPLRPSFVKVVNEDLSDLVPRIQAPTLIVWGGRDKETPVWMGRQMAQQIPGAQLVVFERAGHFAYLDEREAFDHEVTRFLAREPH